MKDERPSFTYDYGRPAPAAPVGYPVRMEYASGPVESRSAPRSQPSTIYVGVPPREVVVLPQVYQIDAAAGFPVNFMYDTSGQPLVKWEPSEHEGPEKDDEREAGWES